MRKDADRVQTNALMSVSEVAAGTKYSTSLATGWRPPAHIRAMSEDEAKALTLEETVPVFEFDIGDIMAEMVEDGDSASSTVGKIAVRATDP